MRKVTMKGKRRRSEAASESESEENGADQSLGNQSDDKAALETSASSKNPAKKRGSRSKGSKKIEKVEANNDQEEVVIAKENGTGAKSAGGKRRKKEKSKPEKEKDEEEDETEDEEYEVERIVGVRDVKGQRQFRVRWKGYKEDDDTWEDEEGLSCPELITEFLKNKDLKTEEETEEDSESTSKAPAKKSKKEKAVKKGKAEKKTVPKEEESSDEPEDPSKEYEVEKILEVRFKKNKEREFLIRWRGYSSKMDSWEPEPYVNCPELINKFMARVEKVKNTGVRELRVDRKNTKRYTLPMPGPRHSRRNADKQRATYFECDE